MVLGVGGVQGAKLVRADSLVRHHHRANVWNQIMGTHSFKDWFTRQATTVHTAITPIGADLPFNHSGPWSLA